MNILFNCQSKSCSGKTNTQYFSKKTSQQVGDLKTNYSAEGAERCYGLFQSSAGCFRLL